MIYKNEPLAKYTYMKVGGLADEVWVVETITELIEAVRDSEVNRIPYVVLGGGSNTIFTDEGYRGRVIINRSSTISITGTHLIAESGASTNQVASKANQSGLSGLSGFFGIPGTIGGAIYNNAHFQDKLIGSYVARVEVMNTDGERQWIDQADLHFAYDYSDFQRHHQVILQIDFVLEPGNEPAVLQQLSQSAMQKRRDSQPLHLPNSGCMFKNPPGQSAGALIDQAGLKGLQIGGARISEMHANFITNIGNATSQDIIELSNKIISTVQDKFGIHLEREVFILNQCGERIDQ